MVGAEAAEQDCSHHGRDTKEEKRTRHSSSKSHCQSLEGLALAPAPKISTFPATPQSGDFVFNTRAFGVVPDPNSSKNFQLLNVGRVSWG